MCVWAPKLEKVVRSAPTNVPSDQPVFHRHSRTYPCSTQTTWDIVDEANIASCRDFLLFMMFTHARLFRCSNVWLLSVELKSLTELVFYCSNFPHSLLLPFYAPQFSSRLLQQSKLFAKCATFFFAFLMAVHCSSGQPLSETSIARVSSSSTNDIFAAGFSSRRVPNLRPSLYSYRWIRAMHSRISPITRMKIFTSGSVDLIFIISITTQLRTLVAQLAAKR